MKVKGKLRYPTLHAFNSVPTKCRLVITFANSLDPDHALDTSDGVLVFFFRKRRFKKNSRRQKHMQNYPVDKASSRAERCILSKKYPKSRAERRNQRSIIRTLNPCRVLIRTWQKSIKIIQIAKGYGNFVELQRNLLR